MLALTLWLALSTLTPMDASRYPKLIEEQRGKIVLVNIWATWCVPCRKEFPELVRLHRERKSEDFSFISISMDQAESRERAQAFLREYQAEFPAYILSGDDFAEFQQAVDPNWPGAIPLTRLFNRDGEAVFTRVGQVTYEELVQQLEQLE